MREFIFKCSIDGEDYSLRRLATVRYQRDIHVLHEMKRAGADIVHDGKILSDDDIDLLGAEEARAVSAATRQSCDLDGIRKLFAKQLKASDKMWREMNAASEGLPLQACVADITITGISYDEFSRNMATQTPFLQNYPDVHPDHHFISKDGEKLRGIETFGMCGGPSEMRLSPVPDLNVPIERDETYPFAFGAVATLVHGTSSNAPGFMQF